MWRNWQTRRFQVPVGNSVWVQIPSSAPTKRTPLQGRPFCWYVYRVMKGFEGGSRFAGAKRFALRSLVYDKLDGKVGN